MRNLWMMTGLVVGLCALTACSTTIRTVSSSMYTEDGVYIGYWEGTCKPILGCGIGDGKVQHCALQPDNSLLCTEQESVSALLARRAD